MQYKVTLEIVLKRVEAIFVEAEDAKTAVMAAPAIMEELLSHSDFGDQLPTSVEAIEIMKSETDEEDDSYAAEDWDEESYKPVPPALKEIVEKLI